ncbi:MAG: pilus assembly protein TadB [Planctomycetaceae bacterium]|nr:pilus assembly protein TadB [Planctomycetaceae bacterium]
MNSIVWPMGLSAAVGLVAWHWRRAWLRDQVRQRLQTQSEAEETLPRLERPFAGRHYIWPVVAGVLSSTALITGLSCPANIAVGIGLVVLLLLTQIDAWILEWRLSRIERQLADCIDILVASVQAGASLQAALDSAANECSQPLKREFEEMVARLRLGDAPPDVFELLMKRVPAESFRLFCTTVTVNWEAGGALASTLAAIGETIRDRMQIARQVRTLSTQGRITTMSVLGVTYFLAAMMWQSDPLRMEGFLSTSVGQWLTTAALVLQGVGIAMVSKISRPKV